MTEAYKKLIKKAREEGHEKAAIFIHDFEYQKQNRNGYKIWTDDLRGAWSYKKIRSEIIKLLEISDDRQKKVLLDMIFGLGQAEGEEVFYVAFGVMEALKEIKKL